MEFLKPIRIKNNYTKLDECIDDYGMLNTLPFDYLQPGLTLTFEEIQRRRDDNLQSLLSRKKLQLVLDLDHTLVDPSMSNELTSEEAKHVENMGDAHHILYGTTLVKLRPGVLKFLDEVNTMFDLSVYTLGYEEYATEVVSLLDNQHGPSRFSWVIANEHCVRENRKELDIVLSHEKMVLIVDDTERVWRTSGTKNLVKISRYEFSPLEKEAKEMDGELARVLSILKDVHERFYDDKFAKMDVDYCKRDVREVLQRVLLDRINDEALQKMNLLMQKMEL